ncbi:MAG: selenide, water dikinase SelD, partial [Cyanobacteria bacterium]|nr:selenide, water dikinase SelD [Cyanobacteriota bacterium]
LITNLVDPPYSGILPCHISGLYDFDTAHIDLRPLTRFAHCRLVMDTAVGLDLEAHQVHCAGHPPIAYDILSIDTGSTPATIAVPGAADYAIAAKPVPQLLQAWADLLDQVRQQPDLPVAIAIVGGGVGGVELVLNMQVRLQALLAEVGHPQTPLTVHLFHRGEDIANGRNRSTRRLLRRHFERRGVKLHLQESVVAVEPEGQGRRVRCASGLTVGCDRVFWVTNAAAPSWPGESGLTTDDQGFILVKDTLQSLSHPEVFAAGDVATMVHDPRPKAGVFAVRQGPPLFHNLQAALQGQPLQPFRPQSQYLNIIDTGDGSAIASRGPFTFESPWMRAWKNRIDQTFMDLFKDFPAMKPGGEPAITAQPTAAPPSPPMPCAGCGSKVGNDVLRQALERVRQAFPEGSGAGNPNIILGLDAPDDAAVVRVPEGQLMVHTVDFFRALVDDPFVMAQIVVKHCLSDLYATGATPQSVLAMITLPYGTGPKQVETLYHLLAGIHTALAPSHTPLVGGHTTEGPELMIGFACNGLVAPDQIWRKGHLQPGHTLIVTQPLGTGTLFAADMDRAAKGRWIEGAIAQMIQSSAEAAHCFRRHGVTACTDVTGFGLLGHLGEMVTASQVSVGLDLTELPVLAGARETLAQGHLSSLHPQNLQAAQLLHNGQRHSQHPDYPLLFDPQTAGGLLAAVPSDRAGACLAELHHLGYGHSRAMGTVLPRAAGEPPITIRTW